jgi:putative lipoic acid-binding regulatory protein
MNTKFDELLDFPCPFTLKIMGVATPNLDADVLEVVQRLAPGDYSPKSRPSTKGNYKSLTLSVVVTSKEHIEQLYTELGALEDVRHVL